MAEKYWFPPGAGLFAASNAQATNITPSKTHGIGDYTLQDFTRAMRKGVAKDGHYLYPAMPYTAYTQVTDKDIEAIYTYFMEVVKPVDESQPITVSV